MLSNKINDVNQNLKIISIIKQNNKSVFQCECSNCNNIIIVTPKNFKRKHGNYCEHCTPKKSCTFIKGQTYGHLVVIDIINGDVSNKKHIKYKVKCKYCETERTVTHSGMIHARNDKTPRCLFCKPAKLVGTTTENGIKILSIGGLKRDGLKKPVRQMNCECHCGKKFTTRVEQVSNVNIKSCGCLNYYPDREKPALNQVYKGSKRMAKKRGYTFNITKEQYYTISQKPCYYCGLKHSNKQVQVVKNGEDSIYIYNGIDRRDNNIGYEISNCVAACKFCNSKKSDMDETEFYKWIESAYNHSIIKHDRLKPPLIITNENTI